MNSTRMVSGSVLLAMFLAAPVASAQPAAPPAPPPSPKAEYVEAPKSDSAFALHAASGGASGGGCRVNQASFCKSSE
jgi:hypothetical protein